MRFGKWLGVVLLWLGCGLMARAQAGVYIGYSATRMTGITCFDPQTADPGAQCFTTNPSALTTPNNHVNPSGVFLGGTYDFRNVGPVRLGVDLRYNHDRANKSASSGAGGLNTTGANTVLAGIKGTVHTPVKWLKPYAEMAFGWTSSNVTEPFGTSISFPSSPTPPRLYDNFFRYEGFIGADIRIAPTIDIRAIEFGLGNMNRLGSTGTPGSTTSVGLQSIGAGIVFHLPTK
ncbi:hypothetical protein [Granulicella mallensis]|uniref:Outer membrane protein beta-barrel domain-containing protein n=1 Tax=Granulicella mallensis TaxID=940614 RepID=A0A7W7ZVV3_9BACT|nr:hypothetical protein [Granulicella mallensis]MBB5066792.1 hypothetical protein [Granulicella mallensis]